MDLKTTPQVCTDFETLPGVCAMKTYVLFSTYSITATVEVLSCWLWSLWSGSLGFNSGTVVRGWVRAAGAGTLLSIVGTSSKMELVHEQAVRICRVFGGVLYIFCIFKSSPSIQGACRNNLLQKYKKQQAFVLWGNANLNSLGLVQIVYLPTLKAWVEKFLWDCESIKAES